MRFEEQVEKLINPTGQQPVKGLGRPAVTKGIVLAFLHYTTAEILK